jgi:hypothetical protein
MKTFVATVLVCALAAVPAAQSDVIAKLGSNMTEAQEAIFSSFSGGFVEMVGSRDVFKAAPPEARAAMVTAVIGVARAYTGTADFAKRYAMFREQQKPEAATAGPSSADALNQQMRQSIEQAIAGMEKAAKAMPQMKKDFDAQIADMRKQLAELGKDKAANAEMDAALKEGAAYQAQAHKQALAEWEKEYPADPRPFIARRLREFLALSSTVDFTARVSKKGSDPALKFDNPAYESKDAQWKYLYRAGKPAVDAARTGAQDWLKAIGG